MADTVQVRVANAAQFDAALSRMMADLRDAREPITAVGDGLLPAARTAAPHGSGALAAAHSGAFIGPGRFRITVDTPYAAALHWGWPGHGIRRRPWITATWLRNQDQYMDRMADAQQSALDREAAKV